MSNDNSEINGYQLSRDWFDFCFENPEKIRPIHTAIYFFAVEHCNRLGWKKKFGFPTQMAMEAIGIKNWRTYNSAFTDLVEFGFIELIEKSKNQYSSCVICLCKKYNSTVESPTKSLDKALLKHGQKQVNSTVVINKQLNNEQLNKEHTTRAKPNDLDEVIQFFENNGLGELQAEEFYDYYDSQGWVKKNGMAITSWQSAASAWIRTEIHNKPEWKKNGTKKGTIEHAKSVSDRFNRIDKY